MLLIMPADLPSELVSYLVEIGKSERFDEVAKIRARFLRMTDLDGPTCLGPRSCHELAKSLDDESLIALIKTLTVSRIGGGGSVSPVIWLFRELSSRSPEWDASLIDWIRGHTDDPYLPFGTLRDHGASSLAEHQQLSEKYRALAQLESQRAEEAHHREARARKAVQATHNLFGALSRHDAKAVTALLARGADIHAPNEQGQTALEYAQSLGLADLLTPGFDQENPEPPTTK